MQLNIFQTYVLVTHYFSLKSLSKNKLHNDNETILPSKIFESSKMEISNVGCLSFVLWTMSTFSVSLLFQK